MVHDESDWKHALVSRLTQQHEAQFAKPWAVTDAPPDYIETRLKAIVGIEILITSIQAKRKLSQNVAEADRRGAAAGLTQVGGPSAMVAAAMRSV